MLDKLTLVNQGNQTRAYKYDALGRLLCERIPEQAATINDGTGALWTSKYTYTDFDAVATKQDARGVITTYSYDNLHRLTGISYNVSGAPGVASTPAVTFTFDTSDTSATKGLLLSVDVGTSGSVYRESYTFDGFNRVSAAAHRIDSRTYTTNFQYNAVSQPTQIAHMYPEYDSKARLFAVWNSPDGNGTAYVYGVNYNIAGQVTSDTIALTVNETYGYDANRMQLTTQTATKAGNTLMNLTYNYQASAGQMGAGTTAGNAGQLMSISGTINGTTESAAYTYDNLGRLVTSNQTSNGSSAQRRFAHDRWGNRTGVWDATSGGNQIQSITLQGSGGIPTNQIATVTEEKSTTNYTYDAAGNVTNDGAHTYVYDAENRVVNLDSGAYTYAYDHQNRRIKKVGGGSNTHYVWQGSQVIAEYNGSTGAQLVWYYYAGGRMISKLESGATRYFLSDRLSTRVVLDLNGNVTGRQAHLPFGEDFGESGTQEKHHFTSYERDGETQTDYAVNRQYREELGRFMRVDPKAGPQEKPQSYNRYAYSWGDPVNLADPEGLNVALGDGICFIVHVWGYTGNPDFPTPFNSYSIHCFAGGGSGGDGDTGSGSGQTPVAPLPSNLRARLRKLLEKNNNECANFVHALIAQVAGDTGMLAYSVDALDLFDAISAQGGYVLQQVVVDGENADGTVLGGLTNPASPATVIISPRTHAGSPFNENAVQGAYVHTALHETIHLANSRGVYNDTQLADAAFNLGGLSDALKDQYHEIRNYKDASLFWDKVLLQHCPRPGIGEQ